MGWALAHHSLGTTAVTAKLAATPQRIQINVDGADPAQLVNTTPSSGSQLRYSSSSQL